MAGISQRTSDQTCPSWVGNGYGTVGDPGLHEHGLNEQTMRDE